MKRLIVVFAFLFVCALSASAQKEDSEKIRQIREKGIKTRMAYCDYKDLYDAKEYIHMYGDPYSPVGAGIASFLIPGLGQILNEQTGKGIGMLLGNLALCIGAVTINVCCADVTRDDTGKITRRTVKPGGIAGMSVALAGALAIDIWSICDAVHVAKIKNLYARDCMLLSNRLDVKLLPSLSFANSAQGVQPAPGMTLAINF